MGYSPNPLEADWDAQQAEADAENIAACEEEVRHLFDAAVAPFKAEYDAAMNNLLGMTGPRWNRARDAVKAKWKSDTRVAAALFDASVDYLMGIDKADVSALSETYTDQWDALISDAEAITKAVSQCPSVVRVGDHDAEAA